MMERLLSYLLLAVACGQAHATRQNLGATEIGC
jgi:hypothetical protein